MGNGGDAAELAGDNWPRARRRGLRGFRLGTRLSSGLRTAFVVLLAVGMVVGLSVEPAISSAASSRLTFSRPVLVDHRHPFAASNTLSGVSCPTTALCVGVDFAGNVVTSTDPKGGASKWKTADVDGHNLLGDISCPTTTLCVAVVGHRR
jgi:hypothetical protein